MFLGLCLLICIASVPLAAGRLARLADLRFTHTWTISAALGIQIVTVYLVPGGPEQALSVALVASYLLAFGFLVANWRVPGLVLVGVGGCLNLLAIVANGGVMPARAEALAAAGLQHDPDGFATSVTVDDARLAFLGDVFAAPSWFPAQNVFSVGDVLLVAGAAVALHAVSRSRVAVGAEWVARLVANAMPKPALGYAGPAVPPLSRPVSPPDTSWRRTEEPDPGREREARLAELVVGVGANVQPGQIVAVFAEVGQEAVVRRVAESCYRRGARYVDPVLFDPHVKRERLLHADEETLSLVPSWDRERIRAVVGEGGALIGLRGPTALGIFDGIDAARLGSDRLPYVDEMARAVDERLVNWTMAPCPSAGWARALRPGARPDAALDALWSDVESACRLDASDPAAAWRARLGELARTAKRLNGAGIESLRLVGPGTDLRIGLLPGSIWTTTGEMQSVHGVPHVANLPTEEVFTSPDPARVEGHARLTLPVDLGGTVVSDLVLHFSGGLLTHADGAGADRLMAFAARDAGAARLGEVGLVDGAGRVPRSAGAFYEVLLDENAASHIALGSGWPTCATPESRDRVNRSVEHLDLMVGAPGVAVLATVDGTERTLLEGGRWLL